MLNASAVFDELAELSRLNEDRGVALGMFGQARIIAADGKLFLSDRDDHGWSVSVWMSDGSIMLFTDNTTRANLDAARVYLKGQRES